VSNCQDFHVPFRGSIDDVIGKSLDKIEMMSSIQERPLIGAVRDGLECGFYCFFFKSVRRALATFLVPSIGS
jgi:hypothetical protein